MEQLKGAGQMPRMHKVDWNKEADFYNAFAFCELEDTRMYLDAIGIDPSDSVLDVCCGPGRISVLAAERAAHVTGIDSAVRMLDAAWANAAERGLSNVDFRLLDWDCVLPEQNLERHDVVIASRCRAMMDIEKLMALATKKVAVQIFADAPSIPALLGVLFSGCESQKAKAPTPGTSPAQASTPFPGASPAQAGALPSAEGGRRAPSAYFRVLERVYDAGYDPNVRIFPERFRKTFATADEATSWVCALKPDLSCGNEERIALNVAPFLTERAGGVEFCIATAAAIIWWDVCGRASWFLQ